LEYEINDKQTIGLNKANILGLKLLQIDLIF